jgi:AcrR family transcriptional regulator
MNNTKRDIFEAALKVFSDFGYDVATMDEIAVEAGVAKGTLYYHFKSKEEIFKFIISEGMNFIKEQIDIVTEKETDPLEKLTAICYFQLNLVYEKRNFFKVVMSQLWGQQLRQSELRAAIERYIKSIEKFLREAMDKGVIIKGEPAFMAYTFFGAICSTAIYELINKDNNNIHEVIENLISFILRGIAI